MQARICKYDFIIILLGSLLFIPFLGSVNLFDWDEINFAEFSREMLITKDYFSVQIDFERFWEKPPLFFWLQVISMKIFGINEFAARFPNAIFGIITILTLFRIGKKYHSEKMGFLWACLYIGSFLPFFYFKSGIIDPVFNYFIFISIYITIVSDKAKKKNTHYYFILGGVVNGLAVLTKGPVALLLAVMTLILVLLLKKFNQKNITLKNIILFCIFSFITSSIWYGYETAKNGLWFLNKFIGYQMELLTSSVAGHGQPFYYHILVILFGCFPISILAFNIRRFPERNQLKPYMISLFFVVLIIFSIVETKIIHYSSMAYIPLSYLAASNIYKNKLNKLVLSLFLIIGTLISLFITSIIILIYNKETIIEIIKDEFLINSLGLDVYWSSFYAIIPILYLCLVIGTFIKLINNKNNIHTILKNFSILSSIIIFLLITIITPKINDYIQKPAIDFYKNLESKDVYVKNIGFKSYAPYFYFKQPNTYSQKRKDINWLLNGNIDKDVYFVTRVDYKGDLIDKGENIKKLYKKGGFIFFKRDKVE